jgi:hypothetical protein
MPIPAPCSRVSDLAWGFPADDNQLTRELWLIFQLQDSSDAAEPAERCRGAGEKWTALRD